MLNFFIRYLKFQESTMDCIEAYILTVIVVVEIIIKQNKITDVTLDHMTNQDNQQFITIKQDVPYT